MSQNSYLPTVSAFKTPFQNPKTTKIESPVQSDFFRGKKKTCHLLRKNAKMQTSKFEVFYFEKKGMVAIQAEVEISRDYLQHLFSQRTPVIYEIESILKKYEVEYDVWNNRISKYIHTIYENYKIKITTPDIPVFAWKPMLFMISTVGLMYLWKYLHTL